MPLPIPDILENASNVLKAAKQYCGDQTGHNLDAIRDALKKVNPDDILAVLNEVGKVYVGLHNIQVRQIGARGNTETGNFEVAIGVEYGLGPRTLITALPQQAGADLCKNFAEELAKIRPSGSLITDISEING